MDRRKALTIAGTAAMVVAAGGIAMAANFGVLGVAGAGTGSVGSLDSDNLGVISETTTTQSPQVIVIDQYDTVAPPDTNETVATEQSGGEAPGQVERSEQSNADQSGDQSSDQSSDQSATKTPSPPTSASTTTVTSSPKSDDGHETEKEHENETDHPDD
jgi:hypothetical protein